jgi:hypothetical protein
LDRRTTWALGRRQKRCPAQAKELPLKVRRSLATKQEQDDLDPFTKTLKARRYLQEIVAKEQVLALFPASTQPEVEPAA